MRAVHRGLLASMCAIVLGLPAIAQQAPPPPPPDQAGQGGGAVQLPPLSVEGTGGASPNASSTVTPAQLQEVPPTEPSDILFGVPGTFFQNDGTPGLSVSVRGMQDFGRVDVMIDGARQDFQVSGHGANGSVYVDPALLSGVDVTRGTVSTAGGAGAIGGVVDLHTIGIDDVLKPGEHYGVLTTDLFGTNGYDGSGMIAGGVRANDSLDFVGAFSLRSSGDYRDGAGNTVPDTYQKLQSGLVKSDIVPGPDQTLQLGGVFYHNDFGDDVEDVVSRDSVDSNTFTAKYGWEPANNPLVTLHASAFYAGTDLDEFTPSFVGTSVAPADEAHYRLATLGGSADNTSLFPIGPLAATLVYGGEYYHDNVETTDLTGNTGETPGGDRSVGGLFTQATLGWNILQLIGGLRYDTYSLTGSGVNTLSGINGVSAGPFSVDKSADAVSPKVTLAVTPVSGLELYGSYGLGFRPPALTETLFSGIHPGLDFLHFVPDPDLVPERTHGWEFGAGLGWHNLLLAQDSLKFKGDYFDTSINDYIAQTLIVLPPEPSLPFVPTYAYYYQNTPGVTTTQGFELEAHYDANFVFADLAYSNISTGLPRPDYTGFDQIVTAPPRSVLAATVGVRFLDGRLTLGERTRAVSATTGQPSDETGLPTLAPAYVVEDLFGSYRLTDNIRLFASVENLGNEEYFADALAAVPSPGLTGKIGLTIALGE